MFDFFISDTHFGHKAIIDLCARPFNSVKEMNESIIENYNNIVNSDDTVLWIGDVSFLSKEKTKEIITSLLGKKWLVSGNHDKNDKAMMDIGFDVVVDSITFKQQGIYILASHYPYRTLQQDVRFFDKHPIKRGEDLLLHGHTHNLSKLSGKRAIHCGVDAWDFKPASIREIMDIYNKNYSQGG